MSGETSATTGGGRVTEVHFTEGQIVKKGDLLLRLDTRRLENETARRKEVLGADEAELARLESLRDAQDREQASQRERAEADVSLAGMERDRAAGKPKHLAEVQAASLAKTDAQIALLGKLRDRAQAKRDRMAPLMKERIIAAAEFADTESDLREAEERLREAQLGREREARQAEQETAQAEGEVREAQARVVRAEKAREASLRGEEPKRQELEIRIADLRGRISAAREELKTLALDLEQSEVRAQVSGIVTRGEARVGDILEAGKPVVAIAQQVAFRVSAAVPASEIAGVKTGMKVRIKLDAYDWQKYGTVEGEVYYISPDVDEGRRADGSTYPYYHVKIALDARTLAAAPWKGRVQLGMTGEVDIIRGSESFLALAWRRARRGVEVR